MSLNDGLIGAWVPTLGNSGAVLLDRSTTRAPADIGGMTWVTQSPYKPVLFNGGSSTYATVAANRRFRRSFPLSFSGWYRFIGLGTNRALFNTSLRPTGNFAGFGAAALTTGALQIGYGDNGGTSATVNQRLFTTSASLLAIGQWYHLAGVFYDHLVADTWVDGVLRANTQSGTGGAVVHNANNMSLGGGNEIGRAHV